LSIRVITGATSVDAHTAAVRSEARRHGSEEVLRACVVRGMSGSWWGDINTMQSIGCDGNEHYKLCRIPRLGWNGVFVKMVCQNLAESSGIGWPISGSRLLAGEKWRAEVY
jgi:hypothetical protein